jgi:hypothetical protein
LKYIGGGGGQNEVEMQNHILHKILNLFQSLHLACFSFENEKEFGVMVLGKVVFLKVVLDEVQRLGQV